MFSEDELKEMEKYASEMKVVKVTFDVQDNTGICDPMSTGLGRNKVLKQVTIKGVPKEKKLFVESKLQSSSIKTVKVIIVAVPVIKPWEIDFVSFADLG